MTGKQRIKTREISFFLLKDFIYMSHELVLLSEKIDWKYFEDEFSQYYSNVGKPSMSVQLMVGSLMLKRIYNLSNEGLTEARVMNPYMQYFCGMPHFQHQFPCDPSDFVHFRNRIREQGVEQIFVYSVQLFGKQAREKMTFPISLSLKTLRLFNRLQISKENH